MQTTEVRPRQRRRNRTPANCEPCRRAKLRCDRQQPCAGCLRRRIVADCQYQSPKPVRPLSSSRGNAEHSSISDDVDAASASASFESRWDSVLQRPVDVTPDTSGVLETTCRFTTLGAFPFFPAMPTSLEHTIAALPAKPTCEYLITSYFQHISPFFHILHGPTFQEQYKAYLDSPLSTDFAWLALLFLICSITVNTLEEDDPAFCALRSGLRPDWLVANVSLYYRQMAMNCLCKAEFLVCLSLGTLEALLLLVYSISHNEGVEQSWTLLGQSVPSGFPPHHKLMPR
jgi:hypothetical protein